MFKLTVLQEEKNKLISLDKEGNYLFFVFNLSGDFRLVIKKRAINLKIFGLYVGRREERFKLSITQHHLQPSSRSTSLIKTVFTDTASFIYRGLIKIEKEGQKTYAYQKNQNLILSETCFIESQPFLEILANDVSCGHAATTGRLNKEKIFYLKTRSLNQSQAKKMVVAGFVKGIFDKIDQLPLSLKDRIKINRLQKKIDRKLSLINYDQR